MVIITFLKRFVGQNDEDIPSVSMPVVRYIDINIAATFFFHMTFIGY